MTITKILNSNGIGGNSTELVLKSSVFFDISIDSLI
jgi:hypothetical protein